MSFQPNGRCGSVHIANFCQPNGCQVGSDDGHVVGDSGRNRNGFKFINLIRNSY